MSFDLYTRVAKHLDSRVGLAGHVATTTTMGNASMLASAVISYRMYNDESKYTNYMMGGFGLTGLGLLISQDIFRARPFIFKRILIGGRLQTLSLLVQMAGLGAILGPIPKLIDWPKN